jgi:hypothetical protein|nr:MAG TPA: Restriction endonuclease [Caudoviricetes sp.]
MFELRCSTHSTIEYEIKHTHKPIILSKTMDKIIKTLLWYAPNIDSFQSEKYDLISDIVYEDIAFTYIMEKMGMCEERDVKWVEPREPFPLSDSDWEDFERCICKKCQKIIIVKQRRLTKINDLLRCLRNCIAHGHFAIVDDYLIGFNVNSLRNPTTSKTAIIKIKPENLLKSITSLFLEDEGKNVLIGYAFEKIGYKVSYNVQYQVNVHQPKYRIDIDLLLEKDGKEYAIEIKSEHGKTYLRPEHLQTFLAKSEKALPGIERVLLIDTSRVTKAVRQIEEKVDNFRIVDLEEVRLLLQEKPVDILQLPK